MGGVGMDTRQREVRSDENFAEWEKEWIDQQRDIEAILKMYTTTTDKFKREITPERTPSTPSVSYPSTQRSPLQRPSHPPPPIDQVSELQSVLDGWRQLEDQFSTSFEKLRLR
eukprot:TRINITY_DN21686_c0_g1_i1.p1 TRINITY_DN21686_c0_g1~~TRINITY_DN21686_c0_g1_i1.p1  ORF type:complete len:123 (+),score=14.10 TRINITY_DN21686_c0_g1_i1:33-371(+)